jgi:hypothetical protein
MALEPKRTSTVGGKPEDRITIAEPASRMTIVESQSRLVIVPAAIKR